MCGILGFFSEHPASGLVERLHAAIHALRHRGPDDQGMETFTVARGQLVLGHTRLSIIDLSTGGQQPMQSLDGRYTIVYNGEIYNYRELRRELEGLGYKFRSDSDTEVLLAAWANWGVESLRRLMGMFAFGVFDRVSQTLTLVRDAFGIKPLFYWSDMEKLAFASEIPALLKLLPGKLRLNVHRAYQYLVFGRYDNDADTFFNNVFHLKPGHWLQVQLDPFAIGDPKRWWCPSIQEREDLSFEDAAMQLREMFLNNVRMHLRSDVSLGAALSGGIDSSAVVCAMRHLEPDMPIHTFSYVARETSYDEEPWIDTIVRHVGAKAHKVQVTSDDLHDDLTELIQAQGEPFSTTSIYAQFRVMKAAKSQGVTVTLDGQGADELLAGYLGYPEKRLQSLLDDGRFLDALRFSRHWSHRTGISSLIPWKSATIQSLPQNFLSGIRSVLRRYKIPNWLNVKVLEEHGVQQAFYVPAKAVSLKGRRLAEQLANELILGRLPRLLRYADRNSMHFSVESRVPFLTIEAAEFLLSLPEHYLVSNRGESKSIFRRAMQGLVPQAVLNRKDKIGFNTPQQDLMRKLGPFFQEIIHSLGSLSFFNHAALEQEYDQKFFSTPDSRPIHWRTISFLYWRLLYDVSE